MQLYMNRFKLIKKEVSQLCHVIMYRVVLVVHLYPFHHTILACIAYILIAFTIEIKFPLEERVICSLALPMMWI